MEYHTSVMKEEVLRFLAPKPNDRIIDATYGGGGHSNVIAQSGAVVLGIDRDWEAVERSKSIAKDGITVVHGNFAQLAEITKRHGWDKIDGVLFDLGVSGHQFDEPGRGFSYRFPESALDMRMDKEDPESAATIVQTYPEETLYEIFSTYGEEERAGSIAHALVLARRIKPPTTVGDLLDVLPKGFGKRKYETATRIFQALRIAVNKELKALSDALLQLPEIVSPGGRVVVLTYHSLEDRIVKRSFSDQKFWTPLTRHPVYPTEEEVVRNPRSRSAKLRAAARI